MSLRFSKHVHHLLLDGEFVLLDIKADRYYLLDETDSIDLVDGLVKSKKSDIIAKLVAVNILTNDACDACEKIRSVQTNRTGIGNHEWGATAAYKKSNYNFHYFLTAVFLLTCTTALMTVFGFAGVIGLCKQIPRRTAKHFSQMKSKKEQLEKMASAIHEAGLLLPFRVQCLESSFALFFFSAIIGVRSKLRIGVQRYDFLAHAWIEFDACVIGDMQSLHTELPVIFEI